MCPPNRSSHSSGVPSVHTDETIHRQDASNAHEQVGDRGGRSRHPEIGDAVLIGPHTHLNGTRAEDEVFIATGVSMFPGSRAGAGCELRINSVLHVNSVLPPGTVVPIGWIAAGQPAQLFSPDRHDELWAVQEPLDFPGTVYGVPRGTSMREIMHRQCQAYGPSLR